MYSWLVAQWGPSWVVETPDGEQHVLSAVNVVTGGVPAFVGMEGVAITLTSDHGIFRRFYARWTPGSPLAAVGVPKSPILAAVLQCVDQRR